MQFASAMPTSDTLPLEQRLVLMRRAFRASLAATSRPILTAKLALAGVSTVGGQEPAASPGFDAVLIYGVDVRLGAAAGQTGDGVHT